MKQKESLVQWIFGIAFILVTIIVTGIIVLGTDKVTQAQDKKQRADVVSIGTMSVFGKLERAEVTFLHDAHTETLEKMQKTCDSCHVSENNKLSLLFKRTANSQKESVMDIYHTNCIDCHNQVAASGEVAGPVACGQCHNASPNVVSIRKDVGFDKSLHFRHSKALDKKCEKCHHEYDLTQKKLVYVKEKEGSCRYCHKAVTEIDEPTKVKRISMREASHLACIECHKKTKAEKKDAGPINCAGCHHPEKQANIKKVANVPRMERKQPDSTMILPGQEALKQQKNLMALVPFNHKGHEEYNDTCRVCHHEKMETCNSCHPLTGSDKGKFVTLEKAMHKAQLNSSCVGCHQAKQQDKNCSGCHGLVKDTPVDKATCVTCHSKPVDENADTISKEAYAQMADQLLKAKIATTSTIEEKDIPEKIQIKSLVDKYEGVDFPHRKIVNSIVKKMAESKLAANFHTTKETICQGCHHNTPQGKTYPKCGNCHGKPFVEPESLKPGLMGAYHQQCMDCHKNMQIKEPAGCTDCHKEKKVKT